MTGWDDDEGEGNDDVREARFSRQSATPRDTYCDLGKETTHILNPFIDSYKKSIRPARDTICGQWSECS